MLEIQGNTISYRTKSGEWIDIPVAYQSAYIAYVNYCTTKDIKPVNEDAFYNSFTLLADSAFLQNLINALGDAGVIPIAMGGTGASNAEDARRTLGVYHTSAVDNAIATEALRLAEAIKTAIDMEVAARNVAIADAVESIPEVTLASLGISWGDGAPTDTTKGNIYFQLSV